MIETPKAAIAAKLLIKTHYIMRVLKFYPDTQTVDLVQDTFEFAAVPYSGKTVTNDFGEAVAVGLTTPDIMYGVPVKQERWGQFSIQCCPAPGDTGYIEVFTNDIRDWVENGSMSVPWSDRHFVKESCVFVPFVPNNKNAATDYPVDNSQLVIKSDNASITLTDRAGQVELTANVPNVRINADQVFVGGDGAQPAVLGNDLVSLLTNLISAYNSHTHTGNLGMQTAPPANIVEQTAVTSEKVFVA